MRQERNVTDMERFPPTIISHEVNAEGKGWLDLHTYDTLQSDDPDENGLVEIPPEEHDL